MNRSRPPRRRRSKAERFRTKGDVRRLVRLLGKHDWLIDREGRAIDLEVGRRVEAVAALGTINAREAEEGLIVGLADRDPRVRRAAVDALRPTPSTRALKALAQAAATWRDPALKDARDAAVEFLVELSDELHAVEFTQVLIEDEQRSSLSEDEEMAVRELFGADSGPVAEIFANQLALRLGAGEEPEQRIVLQTLVAMGEVSVGPLVLALDDASRRCAAATALGAIRSTTAVPRLVALLSSTDPDARAAGAAALGDIRDPRAVAGLMRASADHDANVRDAALEALDRMRGVIIAMLRAPGFVADHPRDQLPAPDGTPPAPDGTPHPSASPLSRRPLDHRSLLQRLRGRGPGP